MGGSDSCLYALRASDGSAVWRTKLTKTQISVACSPALSSDGSTIYAAANTLGVRIDAVTGECIWAQSLPSEVSKSAPALALGETIIIFAPSYALDHGGPGSRIYTGLIAMDVATGVTTWALEFSDMQGILGSVVVMRDGPGTHASEIAIFCTRNAILFGVSTMTGQVIWRMTMPGLPPSFLRLEVMPTAAGDLVVFATGDAGVCAVHAATGVAAWSSANWSSVQEYSSSERSPGGVATVMSTAYDADASVVIALGWDANASVTVLSSLDAATGALRTRVELPGVAPFLPHIIDAHGTVLVVVQNISVSSTDVGGLVLFSVNMSAGSRADAVVWQAALPPPVTDPFGYNLYNSPTLIADGAIVYGNEDGEVALLGVAPQPPQPSLPAASALGGIAEATVAMGLSIAVGVLVTWRTRRSDAASSGSQQSSQGSRDNERSSILAQPRVSPVSSTGEGPNAELLLSSVDDAL